MGMAHLYVLLFAMAPIIRYNVMVVALITLMDLLLHVGTEAEQDALVKTLI